MSAGAAREAKLLETASAAVLQSEAQMPRQQTDSEPAAALRFSMTSTGTDVQAACSQAASCVDNRKSRWVCFVCVGARFV